MLNTVINVDLHIHSKASAYKDGIIVADSDLSHLDVLFTKLEENDINLFSITDHNRFDYSLYKAINDWIGAHPDSCIKAVLAGVEFDVRLEENKPACHIVTIFNVTDWGTDGPAIENAIAENQLNKKDDSYSITEFETILRKAGLDFLLIAHQHEGLLINPKKKRSLSNSTSTAKELLMFGYINAVEYNNSKVQGILLDEFYQLEIPTTAVVGSDCHTWNCYPAHDEKQIAKRPFYTRIKCLPTFQGLLLAFTSPETRFQVPAPEFRKEHIRGFKYGEKEIHFSPGINAIIGENGSGKSSVLRLLEESNPSEKWISAYKKAHSISTDPLPSKERAISIKQGELRRDYDKGALFANSLFKTLDNSVFEQNTYDFSNSLKETILDSIKRKDHMDDLAEAAFHLDPELEGQVFNINVTSDETFTDIENEHSDRYKALVKIKTLIQHEIDFGYYDEQQSDSLERAKQEINDVIKFVRQAKNGIDAEIAIRNIIHLSIEEYSAKCSAHTTEIDARKRAYRKEKNALKKAVCNIVEDAIRNKSIPTKLQCPEGHGVNSNLKNGFKFQTTAKYAKESDLTTSLLKVIFNKSYQKLETVCEIDSIETLSNAITGSNDIDWSKRWDAAVEKFIVDMESTEPSILDQRSKGKIGNTFGEQSLTFYKYKSFNSGDWDVLIVDQPEDDISHSRINEELIEYFNNLRATHQIIMVTHNPLLVVNLDADNVIVLEKESDKLNVISGCLESPGILDKVANHMDGGRAAIQRRVKAYDANNGD